MPASVWPTSVQDIEPVMSVPNIASNNGQPRPIEDEPNVAKAYWHWSTLTEARGSLALLERCASFDRRLYAVGHGSVAYVRELCHLIGTRPSVT